MRLRFQVLLIILLSTLLTVGLFFKSIQSRSKSEFLEKKASSQILQEATSATPTPTPFLCSEPQGGCGSGYYWDSGACICQPNPTTSSCSPPQEGCPYNYYWDSYSCSCKYYEATPYPCASPSSGCGSGYYWDSSSCSCKSEGTTSSCSPPASGCGTNYYWDYYNCSCKPYQQGVTPSCYSPPSGCGYNYYWDSASCSCKLNPSVTPCYPPTGGCSSNAYWDYYSCSCKNYYPYYQQEHFDRLAYESGDRINCVKSKLSSYEFDRLRYFVATNQSEQDEINSLGAKVSSCWAYSGPATQATAPQTAKTPLEYETCLVEEIGDTAYKEIYQGLRKPTYEEHLKYEKCFGQKPKSSLSYYTNQERIPSETESCLRNALGENYTTVKAGRMDVPYETRESVNRCFGINPQAFEEGRVFKIPDSVKSCLISKVGEDRFNTIRSGQEPSENEKRAGEECFAQLNKDQLKYLPLPPEQVPFLTASNIIKFAKVAQESKRVKDQVYGGKVVFSGQGPAGSVVTIYIFTEPIVVTTKTDENGEWVYELEEPLKGEKHVAYAAVKDEQGNVVRSSVFDFTVVAAEQDLQRQLIGEESLQESANRRFVTIAFIVVGTAITVSIVIYGIFFYKKIKKLPAQNPINEEQTTNDN